MAELRGDEAFLHDLEGDSCDPHPDCLAWNKACDVCAHRTSDPQDIGYAYQQRMRVYDGSAVFYCLHRDDAGMHRVCACYAAINRLPRISASRDAALASEEGR